MTTLIRPEISKSKDFWISKHRYYELKHFCLQYPEWKAKVLESTYLKGSSIVSGAKKQVEFLDPVHNYISEIDHYQRNMEMVEAACEAADMELKLYLLEAVTKEVSWEYLKQVKEIPCGRSAFYKAYRKVFWILDKLKT